MTRSEDIETAARLGVDAVGLVFYPQSARHVSVEHAQQLSAAVPAFITITGVFMDPTREQVEHVLQSLRIDLLQFHGKESPVFCRGFKRPYLKAVPMGSSTELADYARRYADAAALLLDSHAHGQPGGSGTSFDWASVPPISAPPVMLAGGLRADNVAVAIRSVHPYGVDVSSGVESAPGIKDPLKMNEFVREVNRVSAV